MRFFLAHNGLDIFIYNALQSGESINYGQPYLEYFDSEDLLTERLLEFGQVFVPRTYYVSYNNQGGIKYGLMDENVNIYEYEFLEYFETESQMIDRVNKLVNNKQPVAWNLAKTPTLFKYYPYLTSMNYKLVQLDSLEGIKREAPVSDKGLKGIKRYFKNGDLIWSSEKKYWFEDENIDGFVRIIKLYSENGDVFDTWQNHSELTNDDRQLFNKQRREMIFEYFKSKYPDLFSLLYAYFTKEITDYVMIGGTTLAETLTWAKDNHAEAIVRGTLAMEVPRVSGGMTTVLEGVLEELI